MYGSKHEILFAALFIGQGGDADTNGAVAVALLGLKFGYSGMPDKLSEGLIGKDVKLLLELLSL